MRSELKMICTISALLFPAFASVSALAQPTGLDDMVGARAGQAENELSNRGYRNVRGEKGDDRSYTYWWSDDRRQCVSIATMNGRYDSITPTTAPDCRMPATEDRKSDRYTGEMRGGGRSDRYAPDARNSRHHMPVRGVADFTELQAICRAEASGRFDRRPSDLTVNAPIRQRNGVILQGWFDTVGKRTTFFTCRFDEDGRFMSVL